ncbi:MULTISPECIES: hypothetical protein [Thermoanaerobacterium]|uniref:Uncharacterized protein n=2 Tax=Thermoanaerobacterium TaxID=28895 RepID=W9EHN6_9THEO|nr:MULTISPECIES: hypothetical protein [Thermoanaerobacterium]AFK86967.1 hypothetical protein Tsac_1963 [Thermoanaerobacterium saccharolyticum JW/SL-YS485]ETO39224.1 hypothetical protein V518_0542 [Thermoanaerobacterium aotearoense SCUT27]
MTKIDQQIEALKWQLAHDTNDKDRAIHWQALKILRDIKNGKCTYQILYTLAKRGFCNGETKRIG